MIIREEKYIALKKSTTVDVSKLLPSKGSSKEFIVLQ